MSSLDILERHHGALAQAAISVVGKGIKKANDLLDIVESPSEYAAIMSGLKSSVDSIGLFPRPKTPLVAIQNNINSETGANDKKKDFEIKINFLHSKQEKKKDEVIDAEVEND